MDRRSGLLTLIAAAVIGALVPIAISGEVPGLGMAEGRPSPIPAATPSPTSDASASPSSGPTASGEGTAGSNRLSESFDEQPMDAEVEGWEVTDEASLTIAALPTAVDRSARLSTSEQGRACRSLPEGLTTLVADFMIDRPTDEAVDILSLRGPDGSAVSLTVSETSSTEDGASGGAAVEPRTWYRWSVSVESDQLRLSLGRAGEDPTSPATVRAPDGPLAQLCISTLAPTRIFLSHLIVEGP